MQFRQSLHNLGLLFRVVVHLRLLICKVPQMQLLAMRDQLPVAFAHGPLLLPLPMHDLVMRRCLGRVDDGQQALAVQLRRGKWHIAQLKNRRA